ncbi:MAG: hypothetical protein ACPLSP_05245, partial [Fervidicoccus fontis]
MKADVVGIGIKEPLMRNLFESYSSFFARKASYLRVIRPRILVVEGELDDIWKYKLDKKARNAIRRAERVGLRAEEINPWEHIPDILECNRSKRGVPPSYTNEEALANEIKFLALNFRKFYSIGVFLKDKLIGYEFTMFSNNELALFSRFLINYKYKELNIGELLLWKGIEKAVKEGAKLIQYGSWSRYHPGLDTFLEHFGFRKDFKTLNVYIPLTLVGRIFLMQKRFANR